MRLLCEKCGAAYRVGDELIPAGGAKVQCPRCKHVQVAQRGQSTPSPVAKIAPPPHPIRAVSTPPAFVRTPVPARELPQSAAPWLDEILNTPAGPSPLARDLASSLFGEASGAAPTQGGARCRDCEKPLSTPFDQSLGLCEECRLALPGRPRRPVGTPLPEPTRAAPEPRDAKGGRTVPRSFTPSPAFSAARPSRRGALFALLGVLFAAGAGGGYVRWRRYQAHLAEQPLPVPHEVSAAVASWQATLPKTALPAGDLILKGRAKLTEDRPLAYREAETLFKQALVQEPLSGPATAGMAEALALGQGAALSRESYDQAVTLVQLAKGRDPGSFALSLALGDLLLTRSKDPSSFESARALADKILGEPGGQPLAEAHLLKGRAYLPTAGPVALAEFDLALKLSEEFKRAYYYRALAYAAVGQYRAAFKDLGRRLGMDADNAEALAALGRLYQDVGEVTKARAAYEDARQKHPEDVHLTVALAALRYQAENKPHEAVTLLRAILQHSAEKLTPETRAEAWTHYTAALRLSGSRELEAEGASALEAAPESASVHLQLLLAAISQHRAKEAGLHLQAVAGRLPEPALESLLTGRVAFLSGDAQGAVTAFTRALTQDPDRVDSALWLSIAEAKAGLRAQAFSHFQQASRTDPAYVLTESPLTLFYVQPGETLKGAAELVTVLFKDERDVLARVLEGALRFYEHDLKGAAASLNRILKVDEHNALGYAYLSLVQQEGAEDKRALQAAQNAVAEDRALALAHYALGLCEAKAKHADRAERELLDAARLAPRLFSAQMKLVELEMKANPRDARDRLTKVLGVDPGYLPAKRALYALEPGS